MSLRIFGVKQCSMLWSTLRVRGNLGAVTRSWQLGSTCSYSDNVRWRQFWAQLLVHCWTWEPNVPRVIQVLDQDKLYPIMWTTLVGALAASALLALQKNAMPKWYLVVYSRTSSGNLLGKWFPLPITRLRHYLWLCWCLQGKLDLCGTFLVDTLTNHYHLTTMSTGGDTKHQKRLVRMLSKYGDLKDTQQRCKISSVNKQVCNSQNHLRAKVEHC